LLSLECIELVETRPVRGATEHFYKGVAPKYLTTSFWEKLSPGVRDSISMTGLRVIFGAIRDSVNAGIFDRRRIVTSQSLRTSSMNRGGRRSASSTTRPWIARWR
jgi:hypothetical protein